MDDSDPQLRVRTEKRSFICNECGKWFKQKNTIQEHLLTVHSEERPYSCGECDSKFKRKKTLEGHKFCVHGRERPFRCIECGSTFKRRDHLRRHIFDVHRMSGSVASLTDDDNVVWTARVERAPSGHHNLFSCNVCDSTFRRKDHFRKHVLKEHRATGLSAISVIQIAGTEMPPRKRRLRKCDIQIPIKDMESSRCPGCDAELKSGEDLCVHCEGAGRGDNDRNKNISNDASHHQPHILEELRHSESLSVVYGEEDDSLEGKWTGNASESSREFHESSDANFLFHNSVHHHEQRIVFHCEICGESFNLNMKLQQHLKRKHPRSQRIPESDCDAYCAATNVEEENNNGEGGERARKLTKKTQQTRKFEALEPLPSIDRVRSQLVATCPSCLKSFDKYNKLIEHAQKCKKYAAVVRKEMEKSRDVVLQRRQYGCSICGSTLLDIEPMSAHLKEHGTNFHFHMCKPCPCEDGMPFIICH